MAVGKPGLRDVLWCLKGLQHLHGYRISSSWGSGPEGVLASVLRDASALRVQVPNNHILTQNLYYNYYYPKPKYLIIGYMDPLGRVGVLKSGVPFLVFDNKPEAATWHGYVGVSQN